jgi:hypothetical protein
MSFLAAALWPLLALAALPLVIHLLTRRPPRPVVFAPIGLLRRALKRHARRMRLRRWLLLALRTLWVAAFALAALLPQLGQKSAESSGSLSALNLLIDGSGSMATSGDDGESFFERALMLASKQAQRRPVALFLCSAWGLKRLAPEARSALPVIGLVGDYKPLGYADLGACAAAIKGETLLLTDAWSPLPSAVATRVVAKPGEGKNWGIGSVSLSRRGAKAYRLRVELIGNPGKRRLELLIDGKARASTQVTLPASGSAFTTLNLGLEAGFYGLELRLPADARSDDNRRVVGLQASGATRLVAIDGDARDTAYNDEIFYVAQAANALGYHDPFSLELIAAGQEQSAPLQEADVVLLANTGALDPGFAMALVSYVRAGGGLLVSVGQNTDTDALQRQLGDLLPGRMRSLWSAKDQEGQSDKSAAFSVATPDPLWLKKLGMGGSAGLLRTKVWQGINLEASGEVRWRLSDGRPLLIEGAVGQGRVLLLATSIDRDGSDLAIRPAFVPLLRGMLRYLAGDSASQLSPSVLPGATWRLPVRADSAEFKRLGGGLAKAERGAEALRFTPKRLGLWRSEKLDLAVELRTDPRESLPQSTLKSAPDLAAGLGGTQRQTPLWPILLAVAIAALLGEAFLLFGDHRRRV